MKNKKIKMVRKQLKKLNKQRLEFKGIFERFGEKSGWNGFPETTILLNNIETINGEKVSDHLWFNYTKGFEDLNDLKKGDVIKFRARVKSYVKGYFGYREDVFSSPGNDFKLSHPTKIEKI